MKKFLPVVFCGIAAISYSQLTLAGNDAKASTSSGAGPTDNPNVTRDAQGREHVNKGKHTGQVKNKKDKDADASTSSSTSGAGSTSAPKSDDANKAGSTSGSASGSTSDPAKTK
jgi:hypothetical protein